MLAPFSLLQARAAATVFEKRWYKRRMTTENLCTDDIAHSPNESMVAITDALNEKLAMMLASRERVRSIEIRWINIRYQIDNPDGHFGHFALVGIRGEGPDEELRPLGMTTDKWRELRRPS